MKRVWYAIVDYIRESDKLMIFITLATSLFGCVMVLSSTRYTGSTKQFITQLVAVFLGMTAAIVLSGADYKRIMKLWPVVAAIGLIPVFLTFFVGFAPSGTDDKAWLMLPGNITFQPSELLKIAFIVTFTVHIRAVEEEINQFKNLFLLALHGAVPVALIHFQGDDGTAMIFMCIMLCMLFAGGVKPKFFIILFATIIVAIPIIYFVVMNDDQRARVLTLFNPESDLRGIGWQQWRARIALANGGFFGAGLFKGPLTQVAGVPKGYNDFIFVSIGEELGLLGCTAALILLCAMCLRALKVGKLAHDNAGRLMCTGFFAMIAFQTIINVGMATSLLPVIGITLPFFSAGGTSLCCLFLGVGLVLSIYRHRNPRTIYLHDDF